ncbi:hypothetical protein AV530_011569 [Patagioenas fasciata monilis]|uniref:Maestro-like HEAT-repeats domain-containing protein n=1 Tax=Patagioenas fasciata monilis TaxID=372326 RepID=A0A1V4L0G3_PATFA|nr:hypothetical protein AV530_011569 [Patagioenas fasciata monilis]
MFFSCVVPLDFSNILVGMAVLEVLFAWGEPRKVRSNFSREVENLFTPSVPEAVSTKKQLPKVPEHKLIMHVPMSVVSTRSGEDPRTLKKNLVPPTIASSCAEAMTWRGNIAGQSDIPGSQSEATPQDEEQKMEFLKCIAMIFRDATYNDLSEGLDLFCQRYELAENIKVSGDLTALGKEAMLLALASCEDSIGFMEEVLEGKDMSLIQDCFSSVFLLPSKEEMRGLKPYLCFMTMKVVDSMLVALVLNSPASEVSEKMQDIFQVPKIMSLIHKTLGCINTTRARQTVESLVVQMADKCPGEVVSTLLTIAPPGDRSYCAAPFQELSQLREISISFFRDLMKVVVGNKRKMKNIV